MSKLRLSVVALWAAAFVAVGLGHPGVCTAATPAYSYTTADVTVGNYSAGFEFTPTVPILVTHLGFYDGDGVALISDHDVGIYDTSDLSLVVWTTVLTTDTLHVGHYLYNDIPDTALDANTTYRIAGVTNGEGMPFRFYTGLTYAPFLTVDLLQSGYFSGGTSLTYPSTHTSYDGPDGASNFLFVAPEPGSMLLLALAAPALLVRRRNHRSA